MSLHPQPGTRTPRPPAPGKLGDDLKEALRRVQNAVNTYDAAAEHSWERTARTAQGRIHNQRRELALLNKRVRELRADVHELTEKLEAR